MTLNTESIDYDFKVGFFNMTGLTREKWENLVEYLKGIPVLDAIILSETHIDTLDTPDFITQDGYTLFSTLGPKQKGKKTDITEDRVTH
jgi:hypothetical protein